jgi:hypothetical protein
LHDLRQLIADARDAAAVAVNMSLTAMYWRIGARIRQEVLRSKRAEYGEKVVAALAIKLTAEFGRGFEEKNLRRMLQFAEEFADEKIVATLWRQLSSGVHFVLGFAAMRATRNWGMIRSGETLEA